MVKISFIESQGYRLVFDITCNIFLGIFLEYTLVKYNKRYKDLYTYYQDLSIYTNINVGDKDEDEYFRYYPMPIIIKESKELEI